MFRRSAILGDLHDESGCRDRLRPLHIREGERGWGCRRRIHARRLACLLEYRISHIGMMEQQIARKTFDRPIGF